MITRKDPTRTTMLRKKYMTDMRKRFNAVRSAVIQAIGKLDALGLKENEPLSFNEKELTANQLPARQAWRFQTDAQKLGSFQTWMQEQVDENILSTTATGNPWSAEYIDSAYRQGVVRSYNETRALDAVEDVEFYQGSREQFLTSTFAQAERVSKLQFLYTRSFE